MRRDLRILFLADTHLGFDMTTRPRVERRRRGPDFFANYHRALEPAVRGKVDLVIHGGDLFFRSRIPAWLAPQVYEPLLRIAGSGIPVCIVPGNHERSVLPFRMLAVHPRIHTFDRPRTFRLDIRGSVLFLTGFPYCRDGIRDRFSSVLAEGGYSDTAPGLRLICMHQIVAGSVVGPREFMFRNHPDVIRGRDLPGSCHAVLSGHIHRTQVLKKDLDGTPLPAPVIYPGSIERTSFAEIHEPKGYVMICSNGAGQASPAVSWRFRELPARPMIHLVLDATRWGPGSAENELFQQLARLPLDAVVRVTIRGQIHPRIRSALHAGTLRRLAPATMNVQLSAIPESG